jgi:signal transduction histidine kinase
VVVPLMAKGRVIGLLDVEHREINMLTEDDVAVLQLLANQVAVAIENARLYTQAKKLAALQERQKLARELHDSVSQALYGIGLGTKTAISILESPQVGKEDLAQPLDYILGLATSALAEMRALIFELRPESLEVEGLLPALARRVDVLRSRNDIQVICRLDEEPELPVEAKEALYRVAQEALHNVGKHANASQVTISLASHNGAVTLEIGDDGSGFELREHYPGHLGLQSMRERVEALGGAFVVDSAPGAGTRIRASLLRG